MQFLWIIVSLLSVSISCHRVNARAASPAPAFATAVADVDNRDLMRLWAVAIQAINEAELQRRRNQVSPPDDNVPQRSNSKRLQWRNNSRLLELQEEEEEEEYLDPIEARQNTFPSLSQPPEVNPAYIDVADNTPAPPVWWF
ncbi:hypothetical protein KR215_003451 [Drosophila sulfurigaster]|nr:hypothetical protein KR215_003451 [Drosophila sulfurigaster]